MSEKQNADSTYGNEKTAKALWLLLGSGVVACAVKTID
jgi:hypothetical protein